MLIGDDDDYDGVLEDTDVAVAEEEIPAETDASSDAPEDSIDVWSLRKDDFELLPLVKEVARAKQAGDQLDLERKMAELRRAARLVDRKLAALQHVADQNTERDRQIAAEQEVTNARTELLARTKRSLDRLHEG